MGIPIVYKKCDLFINVDVSGIVTPLTSRIDIRSAVSMDDVKSSLIWNKL